MVQTRDTLSLEVGATGQIAVTFSPRAPHAKFTCLRLSLALLQRPLGLYDLLSHLLVEVVLVLVELLCEVLLCGLDLFAELLNVLSGLRILNDLTDRSHDVDNFALIGVLAQVGEDRDAG